jgi:hypothetical protein
MKQGATKKARRSKPDKQFKKNLTKLSEEKSEGLFKIASQLKSGWMISLFCLFKFLLLYLFWRLSRPKLMPKKEF